MTTLQLQSFSSFAPSRLPAAAIDALYVHVPFCFHKCHYCDFYSITRQSEERMSRFVSLVLAEAQLWADSHLASRFQPATVFFGGGTPSLLPLESMRLLIQGLKQRIDLSCVNEWTVEANPATVRADYCCMLRDAGVDRLSFGAQSFHRGDLATLERHHDPDDVARSVEIARGSGFVRLNVDLIYAIPGQDLESWSRSLETALALRTPHLSCYGLTYETNTPIAVKKRLGLIRAAEETLELQMLHYARRRLREAGLQPYEISNYSTDGEECRHNLLYWTGGSYLSLGPSAASHVEGWRWRNRPHLGEWEQAIAAGQLPATEVEALSPDRRAGELAMLLLRLERGLNFDDFSARTQRDARVLFAEPAQRLAQLGLLQTDDRAIRLTETGINVADAVAAEFLDVGR